MNRALIDWDVAADGIWLMRSYTFPGVLDGETPGSYRSVSFNELLSAELRDALKSWNDRGDQLFGGRAANPDPEARLEFLAEARALAVRAQAELGDRWEVLHIAEGGAFTWVCQVGQGDDEGGVRTETELPDDSAPALDRAALEARVREVIAREVERVDDPVASVPGGDPSDEHGWYSEASGPHGTTRIGRPFYNPEAWRWFELVDVACADDLVIVVFRWTDPTTPPLRYVIFCHVDHIDSVKAAGWIVRMQLRRQLAPGWRERLDHWWLSRHHPVLFRPAKADMSELDEYFWTKR